MTRRCLGLDEGRIGARGERMGTMNNDNLMAVVISNRAEGTIIMNSPLNYCTFFYGLQHLHEALNTPFSRATYISR